MSEQPHEGFNDEAVNDWLIAEQIFKENDLQETAGEAETNDFLRIMNAIGLFLASLDTPPVDFAQFSDKQVVVVFGGEEPVELPSPFFPADDEKQMWVIKNISVEDLESYALESAQISSLTAYGYNKEEKMMLFNLQEQKVLGINGYPEFSEAMIKGLAVEHAMEPWNSTRIIYFVGFGEFGHALKYALNSYHSNIRVTDKITDIEHNAHSLDNATLFCIGESAGTIAEFIKTTQDFSLGVVCDTQLGGGFTYYQEGEDDGAIEPGNVWIQPFLMEKESEDYETVLANYEKYLKESVENNIPEEKESLEPSTPSFTDEELQNWLNEDTSEDVTEDSASETEKEAEAGTASTEVAEEDTDSASLPELEPAIEPDLPQGYLKLMGEKATLIGADNQKLSGFPAQLIAYTYLQQTFGESAPTFADLCRSVWNAEPTGKEKSKLSARRKRAKEKLSEMVPEAELILEREGWQINNLVTDIDLISTNPSTITPQSPLTGEDWAQPYRTALETKIDQEKAHLDS